MLHWLAGQRPQEGSNDPNAHDAADGPETPAPVFAVRAFKQALFGTPQSVPPKSSRRHSTTDHARPINAPPARPGMTRPRSSGDAQGIRRDESAVDIEPLPSPTKGILVTPGTSASRRKTVSFEEHVRERDSKRPHKSGLPDNYPGKFPSPGGKSGQESSSSSHGVERPRARSGKLTEALEQARDESIRRKPRPDALHQTWDDPDDTLDFEGLQSDPGKHWKHEYDVYREKTTREVKRLVAKRQAAKDYAKAKDEQCMELSEQLRLEKKKVDKLESKMNELEAQVKDLQEQLRWSRAVELSVKQDAARGRDFPDSSALDEISKLGESRELSVEEVEKLETPVLRRGITELLRDRGYYGQPPVFPKDAIGAGAKTTEEQPQARMRLRNVDTKVPDDLWGNAFSSSQVRVDPGPPSPTSGRKVTSGTDATPLKSLSVNTRQQDTRTVAMSMGLQPPSPPRARPYDSPFDSPELPLPSPDVPIDNLPPPRPKTVGPTTTLESSPFQPDMQSDQHRLMLSTSSAAIRAAVTASTKENVSPTGKSRPAQSGEKVNPSSTWSALNPPAVPTTASTPALQASTKRMLSKNGEEVGEDRLAAAKARIMARGRQVS